MASDELMQLWDMIRSDLHRARETLPPEADAHPSIREYREFLEHNELELACDMLESYAEQQPVSQCFWRALRDAATKMKLFARASRYDALAGQ
jgi:hypothetical protein